MLSKNKLISLPDIPKMSKEGKNTHLKLLQRTFKISLGNDYKAKIFHVLHIQKLEMESDELFMCLFQNKFCEELSKLSKS